jgi:2-methylisocitrate lyase-like PEP mutase family enzyme
MIEDQLSPKKCGHTKGKQVIGREEARMKIRAAVEAARGADILILARTDAKAVHGFDEALQRCKDFEAEGADIIFLEAPESEDEMKRFCATIKKPCLANMVPGGKTPILPVDQLTKIGYRLAVYPVMTLSAAITTMRASLAALKSGAAQPAAVTFPELQQIVGFPAYWERETKYKAAD